MSGALASIKTKASAGINKAASAVGIQRTQTEDSNNALEEISELCPQLTYQQRIIGFGTCFVLGYLITFLSFNYFIDLIEGRPVPFVMLYTLGNIISLFSSLFVCGPKSLLKKMFDEKRKVVTIIYLSSLFVSIVVCFIKFNRDIKLFVLLVLLVVQLCSSIWYSLSYIPFARRAVKKCFKNTIGDEAA